MIAAGSEQYFEEAKKILMMPLCASGFSPESIDEALRLLKKSFELCYRDGVLDGQLRVLKKFANNGEEKSGG